MNKSIRRYATKQGAITGVSTVILCLIIFSLLVTSGVQLSIIFSDLSITIGSTGLICGFIQVLILKGPVKKGAVPLIGNLDDQAAYLLVPKNVVAFLLYLTIVELLLFAFAPIGIISMFISNGGEISRISYILLKALLAGAAAGYSAYHANIFVCSLYQQKLKVAEE